MIIKYLHDFPGGIEKAPDPRKYIPDTNGCLVDKMREKKKNQLK